MVVSLFMFVKNSVKVLVVSIIKHRQTWLTCLPGLAPVHGAQLDLVVGVHLQKQALRHVVVETWGTIEIIEYFLSVIMLSCAFCSHRFSFQTKFV